MILKSILNSSDASKTSCLLILKSIIISTSSVKRQALQHRRLTLLDTTQVLIAVAIMAATTVDNHSRFLCLFLVETIHTDNLIMWTLIFVCRKCLLIIINRTNSMADTVSLSSIPLLNLSNILLNNLNKITISLNLTICHLLTRLNNHHNLNIPFSINNRNKIRLLNNRNSTISLRWTSLNSKFQIIMEDNNHSNLMEYHNNSNNNRCLLRIFLLLRIMFNHLLMITRTRMISKNVLRESEEEFDHKETIKTLYIFLHVWIYLSIKKFILWLNNSRVLDVFSILLYSQIKKKEEAQNYE